MGETSSGYTLGTMAMPANFHYRDVLLQGKPEHGRFDSFRIRHPKMDNGRRAKIFAPFDALKGFNEAVAAKDVEYIEKAVPEQEEAEELDRRLAILRGLTGNSRIARANQVQVTVTYYEPCNDINHEAYRYRGRYRTVTGICWNVDPEITETVAVGRDRIPIREILKIEAPGGLFERKWAEDPAIYCEC